MKKQYPKILLNVLATAKKQFLLRQNEPLMGDSLLSPLTLASDQSNQGAVLRYVKQLHTFFQDQFCDLNQVLKTFHDNPLVKTKRGTKWGIKYGQTRLICWVRITLEIIVAASPSATLNSQNIQINLLIYSYSW